MADYQDDAQGALPARAPCPRLDAEVLLGELGCEVRVKPGGKTKQTITSTKKEKKKQKQNYAATLCRSLLRKT